MSLENSEKGNSIVADELTHCRLQNNSITIILFPPLPLDLIDEGANDHSHYPGKLFSQNIGHLATNFWPYHFG